MADAAYKLTRREGRRATVVRVPGRTANPLTGAKSDNLIVDNIRLVVKEQTAYSRIVRAQATQETVGGTTFIFWTRDVSFTRLDVEDYIIMDGVKHQVVTSVVEDTSLVVTAKEIVGVVPKQEIVLSLGNSLGVEPKSEIDEIQRLFGFFVTEGTFTLTFNLLGGVSFTTGAIPFDTDDETLEAAIDAAAIGVVAGFAAGDIKVTAGNLVASQPFDFRFSGASVRAKNHPEFTADGTGLNGGFVLPSTIRDGSAAG